MDGLTLVLFLVGLALLIGGAELLVRGASRLASAVGISPLVIGLTVVAFGTSSPEMAVSVSTVIQGQADMAVGNVIGSNIFNVLLILGISAVITPLIVQQQLIRLDVPVMIGVSLIAYVFMLDGTVSRIEGLALFTGVITYTIFLIRQARRETKADIKAEYAEAYPAQDKPQGARKLLANLGFVIVGLAALIVGSDWLVNGAVAFARVLGVDELVIGLTIIAAGTSLPEVATSILAAIRKERDIAVGNVVGSNIFNLLSVLGLSSIFAPSGLSVPQAAITFDAVIMVAIALACLPIFFTGNEIARWEGAVFLVYYVAYTVYLVFNASGHAALPMFSSVMLYFVVPITILTLLVTSWRALRHRNNQPIRM